MSATEKNRIDKVTTKTGDDGKTSFPGKGRISKAEPVIKVLAGLDVVIAQIGVLKSILKGYLEKNKVIKYPSSHSAYTILHGIQNNLMNICGELASKEILLNKSELSILEDRINEMNNKLPPCKDFVVPGYSKIEAQCHVIRTEIRRAETDLAIIVDEMRNSISYKYINRLSDFFFVLARIFTNSEENYWKH